MGKNDQLFIQLLYVFHASAMQALGKVESPVTGKIEKNPEQAKQSVEMLEMIKARTAGNLSQDMIKALDTFLTEIKLKYADEMNKK
jgi:hypothetical protein